MNRNGECNNQLSPYQLSGKPIDFIPVIVCCTLSICLLLEKASSLKNGTGFVLSDYGKRSFEPFERYRKVNNEAWHGVPTITKIPSSYSYFPLAHESVYKVHELYHQSTTFWWSLCNLYLLTGWMIATVVYSGLCSTRVYVTSFGSD